MNIHTFLIFWLFKLITADITCVPSKECFCFGQRYEGIDQVEYHCPPEDFDKDGIVIKVQKHEILIECSNISTLSPEIFPKLKNGTFEKVEMKFCPLNNFKENIGNLTDLNRIVSLKFQYSSNEMKLNRNNFEDFQNLKQLDLSDNHLIDIDPRVFELLPNLVYLNLAYNRLQYSSNFFKNITNLFILNLSNNKIKMLPNDIFDNLYQLKSLELGQNNLSDLKPFVFKNLVNLKMLDLHANNIKYLHSEIFTNLTNLERLNLGRNPLHNLNNIFRNQHKLKILELSNCTLENITGEIFENLTGLKVLKLDRNQLIDIPEFPELMKLESLFLQNNLLKMIGRNHFQNLKNLKNIDLSQNKIYSIHSFSFASNIALTTINLSGNQYNFPFDFPTPFQNCINLEILNLSHNNITDVDLTIIVNMLHLNILDLSSNYLTNIPIDFLLAYSNNDLYIDLSNNLITGIEVNSHINFETNTKKNNINLKKNPLNCDCHMIESLTYFQNPESPLYFSKNLTCSNSKLLNISIADLKPEQLRCLLNENEARCPKNCTCEWRPYDKSIVVNCSSNNFDYYPELSMNNLWGYNQTELHLEDNILTQGPDGNIIGYNNVTMLYLSNNSIEQIDWLPPSSKIVHLQYNKLERIESKLLEQLNTSQLEELILDGNKWICDCASIDFINFLRKTPNMTKPYKLLCANGTPLIDLTTNDLCVWQKQLSIGLITLLVLSLIISGIVGWYYSNKKSIKIWLYNRNFCLCWVKEDEIDDEKEFDIFISYATDDEDFVLQKLFPKLNSYKICWHRRDWIPGKLITTQITNSVQKSRRTIVVLSKNFLKSTWAKLEFSVAHNFSMEERRVRLIVILLEDIDVQNLDNEIVAYLRTNTYVKWGDNYFWDKLRYALPHSKQLQNDV